MNCIYGCENAVVLAFIPKGCVCHTEQWQWLCAQHWVSLEPIEGAYAAPDYFLKPIAELTAELGKLRAELLRLRNYDPLGEALNSGDGVYKP